MSENIPEELPEEDLQPEPAKKDEPFATVWDVVVVLVLALVAGGFWFWYSSAKNESSSHFRKADSLFQAGDLPASLAAYRELRASESVIAGKDDSLMYKRMDSLEAYEETDLQLAAAARGALTSEDTALIRAAYEGVRARTHGFVPKSLIDSLEP